MIILNKKEAAKYLGCTESNLQRLMGENKIQFSRIQGKFGLEVFFEQAELDRYKAEKEVNSLVISPSLTPSSPSSKGSSMVVNTNDFMGILEKIAQGLNRQNQQLSFPLENRLTLTLEEAAGLSGFPVGTIKKVIKDGLLKSVKIGRARRVRREDLETWVKEL
jgi:excisionase family DNA binding protein